MMNLPLLLLGLIGAAAVVAAVWLYLRLRKMKTPARDAPQGPSRPPASPSEKPLSNFEMLAIDQFLYDKVCRYMTEHKPFLVEGFSLQDLANAIYTNKVYLSKTINHYSGKNFRQYVNYYRVMYAMDLFRNNMSLRVSELAELSGFHSATSFFQSFRNVMGEAPSHWCRRVREKYKRKKQ
jgi:AraC-like DNA-binding protein